MSVNSKIKPLYEELKGILEELPAISADKTYIQIHDSSVWKGYFEVLDLLAKELGEDLSRFRIEPKRSYDNSYSVEVLSLRQKVSKAIKYIGSKFLEQEFNDVNSSGIYINQSQSQKQDVYVIVSLKLQERIIEVLKDEKTTDSEKNFLETLKGSLTKYSDTISLFSGILELMIELNIAADFVLKLFT